MTYPTASAHVSGSVMAWGGAPAPAGALNLGGCAANLTAGPSNTPWERLGQAGELWCHLPFRLLQLLFASYCLSEMPAK